VEASGTWLVLGGMGLAAVSNAQHLRKPNQAPVQSSEAHSPSETEDTPSVKEDQFGQSEEPQQPERQQLTSQIESSDQPSNRDEVIPSEEAQSEIPKEDAILFEMRVPWW